MIIHRLLCSGRLADVARERGSPHGQILAIAVAAGLAAAPAFATETKDNSVSTEKPNISSPVGAAEAAPAKDCLSIDFKTAELVRSNDRIVLKVSGEVPHGGMSIEVRPVVYFVTPDYWQMSLVACTAKDVKAEGPAVPFSAEINVSGSLGRKGIALTGKSGTKPKRLELAD